MPCQRAVQAVSAIPLFVRLPKSNHHICYLTRSVARDVGHRVGPHKVWGGVLRLSVFREGPSSRGKRP